MTTPVPIPDADSEPYLAALRRHELVLQHCTSCARVRFPPMPACPWCGGSVAEWRAVSGRGRVYSWVGVQRALTPDFEAEVPYTIATVELEEGARVSVASRGPNPARPGARWWRRSSTIPSGPSSASSRVRRRDERDRAHRRRRRGGIHGVLARDRGARSSTSLVPRAPTRSRTQASRRTRSTASAASWSCTTR